LKLSTLTLWKIKSFSKTSRFKNKIKICESEASETQYWLEVIVESKMLGWEKVKQDHQECSELLALFASIARDSKL
jgi:four helix bundle protein